MRPGDAALPIRDEAVEYVGPGHGHIRGESGRRRRWRGSRNPGSLRDAAKHRRRSARRRVAGSGTAVSLGAAASTAWPMLVLASSPRTTSRLGASMMSLRAPPASIGKRTAPPPISQARHSLRRSRREEERGCRSDVWADDVRRPQGPFVDQAGQERCPKRPVRSVPGDRRIGRIRACRWRRPARLPRRGARCASRAPAPLALLHVQAAKPHHRGTVRARKQVNRQG